MLCRREIGVAYFFVYYFVFRFVIRRFRVPTPGREADDEPVPDQLSENAVTRVAGNVDAAKPDAPLPAHQPASATTRAGPG